MSTILDFYPDRISPEPNSGCWLWDGARFSNGYGSVSRARKTKLAHRISYEISKGLIPREKEIDHLCRVRCCVNPDHLEAVTPAINNQRGGCAKAARLTKLAQTHCKRGHTFSGDNLAYTVGGHRRCRACTVENTRKSRVARRSCR